MGDCLYTRRAVVSFVATAACGAIGWSGKPVLLPVTFLFLTVFLTQRDRKSAYAVALMYYAASTWPLVPGANSFFGPHSNFWLGLGLWLTASCLLALPWGLSYFSSWPARYASVALALAATTFPPIGIIGWTSPLTSAGLLFPGFGWLGVLATILLPPLIVRHRSLGAMATITLIGTAHSVAPLTSVMPATWAAINTTFGREPEPPDPVWEFQTASMIQQLAVTSVARVVLFPEAAVPRWNEAAELFWEPTLKALAGRGRTVLVGTTVGFSGTSKRLNGVLIRGADKPGLFIERVPVPVSMWRPFSHSGYPLRLGGPGTVQIAGERAGFLICYEMLLTWPVLSLSLERPTILVGAANDYWARDTSIPEVQRMCISAWARLFSIPSLMAKNT